MELKAGKDALHNLKAENLEVKYDPSLMDCGITEKGFA